jgi:PhzF family phenazine biosynthesis protein
MSIRSFRLPIYQVDAFTDAVFAGNPAAILPLQEWLPDEVMQNIAMENQLSETAFFVSEGGTYALRWFTPVSEVDLCGHATLAAAHVLFRELHAATGEVKFETRSGTLAVEQVESGYRMDFPADELRKFENDEVAAALGAPVMDLYRGKEDFLAVVAGEQVVRGLRPDFHRIAGLEARGVIVTARADVAGDFDFVSRCFFPKYGIDEDPVTGSAHTSMMPYWGEKLNQTALRAAQISARGGRIDVELIGDRVALSGNAVTFLRGEIELPARPGK